jgi:hypothetical protein
MKPTYQHICSTVGRLAQHIIRWIGHVSSYIQNSNVFYLALVGANIAFFELTLSISRKGYQIFNRGENYEELPPQDQYRKCLYLGASFIAGLGGCNWVFCKILQMTSPLWKIIAVSTVTNFGYLCFKSYNINSNAQ